MRSPAGGGSSAGATVGASLIIGGRSFVPMNLRARTVRADFAQTRLISELGLDRADIAPAEGETLTDYVSRLQGRILATGRMAELIGHYLLPLGKTETDWTVEMAAETANVIELAQDEASRRLVWELAAEFVFFFLRSNLQRLAISASYSDPPDERTAPAVENPGTVEYSSQSSGSGRRLSDRWPRTTGLLRWPFRAGRSENA